MLLLLGVCRLLLLGRWRKLGGLQVLVVHPVRSLLRLSVSMLLRLLLLRLPVPAAMMPTPTPTPTLLYFLVFHTAASRSHTLVVRVTKLERPARLVPQVRHRWHKCGPGHFRISTHIRLSPVVGGGIGERGRRRRAEEVRVVVRVVGMMRVVWMTWVEL